MVLITLPYFRYFYFVKTSPHGFEGRKYLEEYSE